MTFGPYGKDVPLKEFMPEAWDTLEKFYPDILANPRPASISSSRRPIPRCWVPDGYIVIKVDSRGAGKSPGRLAPNSPEEFRDFYDAIEWAGVQPWCNGKVGLPGISYYAAGQWSVASLKPPHLAALLPWQGTYDFYRDRTRQDGIYRQRLHLGRWWARSVLRNQHGNAESPYHDLYTGERNHRRQALTPEQLAANRADYPGESARASAQRRLVPGPHARSVARSITPTLVVANWGGLGAPSARHDRRLCRHRLAREMAEDPGRLLLPHLSPAAERRDA